MTQGVINDSVVGYHPVDDFFLSEDLVYGTLFLQVLLWNFLLYLLIYDLILIIGARIIKPSEEEDETAQLRRLLTTGRVEDEEDGMHYMATTVICFAMTTFSISGLIIGQSLFAIAFLLTVPINCLLSVNTLLDSDFGSINKFFGSAVIDTIATVLLILVEATTSLITMIYLYQVISSRYAYILAVVWPLRFHA